MPTKKPTDRRHLKPVDDQDTQAPAAPAPSFSVSVAALAAELAQVAQTFNQAEQGDLRIAVPPYAARMSQDALRNLSESVAALHTLADLVAIKLTEARTKRALEVLPTTPDASTMEGARPS